jgi:hypothetical protein
MRSIENRVTRLESIHPPFPWRLPIAEWTDEQLEAVMCDPVRLTDAQLAHIAAGEGACTADDA